MKGLYFVLAGVLTLLESVHSVPTKTPVNTTCPDYQVFYPVTGKCHLVNEQGPCGQNMVYLNSVNNSMEGECECEHISEGCASRPLLFWSPGKRCYPIFDKGPCKDGEWLMVDGNNNPICKQNSCPPLNSTSTSVGGPTKSPEENRLSVQFVFLKDGKCYTTKTQAYCPVGQVAYFPEDSLQPSCDPAQKINSCNVAFSVVSISNGNPIPCPKGTRDDGSGTCADEVTF